MICKRLDLDRPLVRWTSSPALTRNVSGCIFLSFLQNHSIAALFSPTPGSAGACRSMRPGAALRAPCRCHHLAISPEPLWAARGRERRRRRKTISGPAAYMAFRRARASSLGCAYPTETPDPRDRGRTGSQATASGSVGELVHRLLFRTDQVPGRTVFRLQCPPKRPPAESRWLN